MTSLSTGPQRGAEPEPQVRISERVAQVTVVSSSALAAAGILTFLAGEFAQGYDVVVALILGLPACLLFIYAARRVQLHDYSRAAIVCVVGGLLTLAEVILAGLSAGYANPCFELAHCTRGPTFGYVALTGATFVFALGGVLGLVISPIAIGLAWWRRHRETGDGSL